MKHSFAATNPCHVYDMALALWETGSLGCYYSGYPRWRLKPPREFPFRSISFQTLVTYAMQRLPESVRIRDDRMFRWQDAGFDTGVAGILSGEGCLHGIPGQCLRTFRRSNEIGMVPVLNHASGPWDQQRRLIAPEYERAGFDLEEAAPVPRKFQERLKEEKELARVHCVASSVVRDQLIEDGIEPYRIWVVPYGADSSLFPKRSSTPNGPFRICFAGRQSLRKGIHYLLKALEAIDSSGWELHCFGMPFRETARDFAQYTGGATVIQRGSLSQIEFARALREMHVLVLPSAEEAFGLVVVQALECGVPCVVSNRVGAGDLIRDGETGSVTPFGDPEALARALLTWEQSRITVPDHFPWAECARKLLLQGLPQTTTLN